ncbi:MAG: hypothetical protein AAF362_09160 [Pseudomonadota bacterium]
MTKVAALANHRNVLSLIVGLLMCVTSASGVNADERFFADLVGNWQGKGLVRDLPSSPQENIRCRLNMSVPGQGNRLSVLGNCSVAGVVLPINGSITAQGNGYSANLFANIVQVNNSNFSGRLRGSKLALFYDGIDIYTKKRVKATLTIAKRGNKGFDIGIRRHDPNSSASFNVGTIRFQAR